MKLIELTKVCTKCGTRKSWLKFHKHKGCRFGRENKCKKCANEISKTWAEKHPEKRLEFIRKYRKENLEKVRKAARKWQRKNYSKLCRAGGEKYKEHLKKASERYLKWQKINPEKVKKKNQRWAKKNPEKVRELGNKWQKINPEKVKKIALRWRKNHPEHYRKIQRKSSARRKSTPKGKLNHNISNAIRTSLKGNKNGTHWENVIGFTLEQLREHLEHLFTKGMNWNNYGHGGWSIDHKIPVSVFNFAKTEHEDFKKCWALNNLQPLWEKDNLEKRAKINKHFQPSLLM